jgi:hypothetical protein
MGKLTDMVVSAIIKRGILYEARNFETEFTIPQEKAEDGKPKEAIKIHLKAEHMTLKIERDVEKNGA